MGAVGLVGLCLVTGQQPAFSQQGVSVRAAMVKGTLPVDDPTAAAWATAAVSEFPMSPQVHWPTRITEVTAKSVKVRGLHDGTNVAILLEYSDPSEDPEDAAALEFMVGDTKAHFAHGQPMAQVQGGPVNIWYWKNKDGKGVDMGAKGFGTLKPHAHQDVKAKGVYQGGAWKVVFSRPLHERASRKSIPNSSPENLPVSHLPFGMGKRLIVVSLRKRALKRRFPPGGISELMRRQIILHTCMLRLR